MANRKFTGKIMKFGEPTHTGRVYSKEVFEKALREYEQKIADKTAYGMLGNESGLMISLSKVCHVIESIDVDDKFAIATVHILQTPAGNTVLEMIKSCEMSLCTSGYGTVKDGVVENFKLTSVNFVPE